MAKAAETLTPVCLELGGNDAMIVCGDADPIRAAGGAVWAGFQNAGQSCGGVERIYVHEKIYDRFMKELAEKTKNLKPGPTSAIDTELGCLTTEKQRKAVQVHIDEALEMGAEIFARSETPEGINNFIPATVLTNVNHEMMVMKDETFGPVVGVMKVSSDEEAIKLANDSYLGLTGSVWSKNSGRAKKTASKIRAGTIMINDHLMSHGLAETAWGGFKESGIGRTHGELGFNEFTQPQMVINDILPGVKKNLWWHPYNKKVYDGLKGVMYMLYGNSIGEKLKGVINVAKIFPRVFKK